MPHESTFSRAFAEFAQMELPQFVHEALIATTQKDRLIGHIARDSTAMEARESFPERPKPIGQAKQKADAQRKLARRRALSDPNQPSQPVTKSGVPKAPMDQTSGTKAASAPTSRIRNRACTANAA